MNVGDLAPDFELPDEEGRLRRLGDFVAVGPLVVFFYPGAMTYGCTRESCRFRDLASEFAALGAQRVGISADPISKQKQFSQTHAFDFPVLSDTDHRVAELYGVRRAISKLPNKRMTFVVDTDRRVAAVIRSEFAFAAHAERSLRALRQLAAPA